MLIGRQILLLVGSIAFAALFLWVGISYLSNSPPFGSGGISSASGFYALEFANGITAAGLGYTYIRVNSELRQKKAIRDQDAA